MKDIKRVLINAHLIPEKVVVEFFSKLTVENACPLLVEIIKHNRQNTKLVTTIAIANHGRIGLKNCIKIF